MVRRRLGKPCQPVAHLPGGMHLPLKKKNPQHLYFESELCSAFERREGHVHCCEGILGPGPQRALLTGVALKGQISGTSLCYWFSLACSAFLTALHTFHSINFQQLHRIYIP